ncbi:MAG: cytochrome c oxidase subunit II [Opitutales bacterium]|nr:cytochrome c oxidase subunit II [Opitutales bacterium]
MRLNSLLSPLPGWGRAALALGATALLTGCDLNFWRMDGHQSTLVVDGPVARSQLGVFYVTCWVTFSIFLVVGGVLAYATWKFRARTASEEQAVPAEQGHGNPLIELGLIGASVLALVIIAIPTLRAIWYTADVPVADKANAYEVNATGLQWWFRFEYPAEQIPGSGPLLTSNELVIPAGRPVRSNLRAADVIHSFWIPKLAGKVDMIPNRGSSLWLQADAPGYFWGQCAEYCGDSHAVMRFRVIALGPREFNDWVNRQLAPARTVATADAGASPAPAAVVRTTWQRNEKGWTEQFERDPLAAWRAHQRPEQAESPALIAQGRALFQSKTCFTCHVVRGQMAGGSSAYPDLTHLGSRTTLAAGLLENNAEQLARWIAHPDQVKPGNKMYALGYLPNNIRLTAGDVAALTAYLQSLK